MNQKTLDQIISNHAKWLANPQEGRCANLMGANLEDVNLTGVNLTGATLIDANLTGVKLWGVIGNLENIKSMQCDRYEIAYTSRVLQIGCEQHPISDWWEFDDETINKMDREGALNWWKVWKSILKNIIETSPAVSTKQRTEDE